MKLSTFLFLLSVAAVRAELRTSASYLISAETSDAGGKKTASDAYSVDASIGSVTGISTVASPAATLKSGYIAQLYDLTGLVLNGAPLTIDEGGTLQLAAWQSLDDSTFLAVPAVSVAWGVVSGPLTSISTSGLATAGIVYQHTAASAQGIYAGNTSQSLALTVLNVNTDDLPGYLADGIDDGWQVQYFGLPPNPNAGPLIDPDGDGQNNTFEYTAGLVPTDANSLFRLRLEGVPGQSGQKKLTFGPRFADRTYTVQAKSSLLTVGSWSAITGSAPSDNGEERTITDLDASGAVKFYQVEITKP